MLGNWEASALGRGEAALRDLHSTLEVVTAHP